MVLGYVLFWSQHSNYTHTFEKDQNLNKVRTCKLKVPQNYRNYHRNINH